MSNPLLSSWDTPFEMPPFDALLDSDIAPALDVALQEARTKIEAVAHDPARPSFENTIEALDLAEATLDRVAGAVFPLMAADSNDAREAIQREFSAKFAAFSSWKTSHPALFARIAELWSRKDSLGLTDEQHRVLMLQHRGFVRQGALLDGADKERMAKISARIAELMTAFGQNLLADERAWRLELAEGDLAGLPDFLVSAARGAGAQIGKGPVITLSRSLIVPFLQFSARRDLREKAFVAWAARGMEKNIPLAQELLELRHEKAQLLGYEDYASYNLETEMAGDPASVAQLLHQVWTPARAAALEDQAKLTRLLARDGMNDELRPWDWRYYAQIRRQAEHALDEEELKPYFALERMIEAAFACSNRLFGLEFSPLDVPLYHTDARAWEVTRNGEHLAVFIGDYFARGSKRSGAWCTTFRGQSQRPTRQTPIVHNVCNFAKPDEGQPALLSYDDARTLFHEFGHALHQMLSNVSYGAVAGTHVARDFVELPSQLFERWLEDPSVLAEFAIHAVTGDPMPVDLRDRLLAAGTFDMGFQTVEYLASALVDQALHCGPPPANILAAQAQVLTDLSMPAAITMRHAVPQFAHIFAGGYSAGYYSYMWSEVMDADAFDAFLEAGDVFDPKVAARLETDILSKGGSVQADVLYTRFRGRMPDVAPLLKGRGLATA